MAGPFQALGTALAGDSELAYQQGLNLGARTEEALATAAERVDKNRAKIQLAEQLKAAGVPQHLADASAGSLRAGGNLGDAAQLLLRGQEHGFRATAGDPNTSITDANAALRGVASGPVDRYQRIGNKAVDDRFDDAGVVGLGDALVGTEGGGDAAGVQMLRAFGLIGNDGRVVPGQEERAFDVYRSTDRSVDLGGTPGVVSANPFKPTARTAAPVASTATVAGNTAEIARQKEVGTAAGTAEVGLEDALAESDKLRKNIQGFLALPGFKATYGNVQGQPGVRTVAGLVNQDIADAQGSLKNLDAQTFGIAIQKMKGLGALSNAEGEKVTSAFTVATNPTIDEQTAAQAWNDVLDGLDLFDARVKRKASMRPSGASTAPAQPAAPATNVEARISSDAEYDALPPGTQFVGPDGVPRVKP